LLWWNKLSGKEKEEVNMLTTVQRLTYTAGILSSHDNMVRDVLLEALFASGSDMLLLPIQDVFGWPDRINEPATVSDKNWTFKVPWPCDRLDDVKDVCEREEALRRWAVRYRRL
jgi:4-alpha-glucanotransferase